MRNGWLRPMRSLNGPFHERRAQKQSAAHQTVGHFLSSWRKCDRGDLVRIDISAPSIGSAPVCPVQWS